MLTTKQFQAYAQKHTLTEVDAAKVSAVAVHNERQTFNRSSQAEYNKGKVPPSLVGKVLLKTEKDPNTGDVVGWHWMTPAQFAKRYTTAKNLTTRLKGDIYIPLWKAAGEI